MFIRQMFEMRHIVFSTTSPTNSMILNNFRLSKALSKASLGFNEIPSRMKNGSKFSII